MCDAIFKTSEEQGYWCAGFTNTSGNGMTVVNSNGVCASFDGSDAIINVKMNGADSTGYAEGFEKDVSRLDASAIGRTAAQKTHDSAQPRSVDPGEWTVILEPAAFGELFAYLSNHFSAQAFDEGSSFLSDGLNTKYLGDNVTVMDDYANPLCPGMPFDYEGQPTQRLTLIENGIAKNIVTDSYWAHKLGRPNTGHALPGTECVRPAADALGRKSGQQIHRRSHLANPARSAHHPILVHSHGGSKEGDCDRNDARRYVPD